MSNIMYSRELLTRLPRLLTSYLAVRVGVRRYGRKQSRFVLRRQSRIGRISIIYKVHDHPTPFNGGLVGESPQNVRKIKVKWL